ncbi:MAG: hypothetical protein JWM85_2063, partial [Acidimicrobiaceae bacterium]|nr:hypothetical protein [Acidimicrobiaceae bacterium]
MCERHPVQTRTVVVEVDGKAIAERVTRLEVKAERPMECHRRFI